MCTHAGTSRRRALKLAAAAAGAATIMVNAGHFQVFADSPRRYRDRTIRLMQEALVIDMLGPLTLGFTEEAWNGDLTDAQFQDFTASGVHAFHHAYGFGGPDAHEVALTYFAAWNGFIARNELLTLVHKVRDIPQAKAEGRIAVIMGVQNSDHFRTAKDVKLFWDLGQRCSQLTYNSQNFLGSGATDRVDGGLSDFGAEIVQEMNRVGMLVDVSHCGDRTTLDAIEASGKPIAITHSNCRALNDHPRLKSDEAIKRLAARGGVMGITGVRNFVRDREPTDVGHVVDHIDRLVKLVGVEHVGIGSDADLHGYDDMPAEVNAMLRSAYKSSYAFREKLDTDGFDHPRKFFDLTEALIDRGYADADILAILGGNFQRLMTDVWSAADTANLPGEDAGKN